MNHIRIPSYVVRVTDPGYGPRYARCYADDQGPAYEFVYRVGIADGSPYDICEEAIEILTPLVPGRLCEIVDLTENGR